MCAKSSSPQSNHRSAEQSANILLLWIGTITLLALGLSFFATADFWAVAPWLQISGWLRLAIAGAAVALVLPSLARMIAAKLDAAVGALAHPGKTALATVCSLGLLALFLWLRSENHILGDGLTVLNRIKLGDISSATEPLTYLINFLLMKSFFGVERAAENAFRLGGIFAASLLLILAYRRTTDAREYLLFLSLLLTFGVVQFFAGYIENYTYAFLAGTLCLLSLCRDFDRTRISARSVILLLLALAFHLSTAVLLPAFFYLWYHTLEHSRRAGIVLTSFLLVCGGGALVLWFAGLLEHTFVPFYTTEYSPYHLLSQQHLLDLANILLRNFALLPVLFFLPDFRRLPQRNLLLAALIPALLFTIFVDPKIGAIRDWDLLSIATAPIFVSLILTLRAIYREQPEVAMLLLLPLLCFGFLHTGSWLWLNSDKQNGYALVKETVRYDAHYSSEYFDGYRLIPWHVLVYNVYDDTEEAIRVLEIHMRNHPDDIYNAYQLAVIKSLDGRTAEAAELVHGRWYPYLLAEPRMAWELSRVFRRAGARAEQEAVLRAYLVEKGDQDVITFELGSVLRDRGLLDSAWMLQASVLSRRNMLPLQNQVDFALFAIERAELAVAAGLFGELATRLPAPYSATAESLAQALARNDLTRIVSLRQSMLHFLDD